MFEGDHVAIVLEFIVNVPGEVTLVHTLVIAITQSVDDSIET